MGSARTSVQQDDGTIPSRFAHRFPVKLVAVDRDESFPLARTAARHALGEAVPLFVSRSGELGEPASAARSRMRDGTPGDVCGLLVSRLRECGPVSRGAGHSAQEGALGQDELRVHVHRKSEDMEEDGPSARGTLTSSDHGRYSLKAQPISPGREK